jgi:hypothetical protein
VDFEDTRAIALEAETLAEDLAGVYKVIEHGFMDGSECLLAGALDLEAAILLGLGDDFSTRNDKDVLVRKFLF